MKPYPKYKDSGIEWLVEIPAHWEIKKLKYLLKDKLKYGANESAVYDNREYPRYIRITDFGFDGKLKKDTFKSLPLDIAEEYLLSIGDILFARSGATVGKTFQFKGYEGIACFAGYLIKASPNKDVIISDFLYLFTKSNIYERWKESIFNQATIQNIGADKYAYLDIPLPKLDEQTTIANYLDRKTAEIDELIAQKERLLELYEEEKTAIINQAVTKGINPDVKMKDSGIEWLGEIPEHWFSSKLKYIVQVKDGTHDTPSYIIPSDNSFPLITSKDLQKGLIDFTECKHISKKDYKNINRRSNVEENDIIMPMIGTVGGAVVIETRRQFSIKNVALFKASDSEVNPYYLKYLIDSILVKNQFSLQSRGGVQDFVSLTILKNIRIFNISIDEQKAIIQHIETETARINTKSQKTKKLIELLKEYRTALISEVVTGKIDVSNEVS